MSPPRQAKLEEPDSPELKLGSLPPKRKRNCTSRVRTGCKTCKIRHLKCDETHPMCRRCQTDQVQCDGYDKPVVRPPVSHAAVAAVAAVAQLSCPRVSPALKPPHIAIDPSQAEQLSFLYAVRCTLKQVGEGALQERLWLRFIPFLGHHVDAVWHALAALGAAHRDLVSRVSSDRSKSHGADHEGLLLTQYNLAIRQLHTRMANPTPVNTQIALVCCLIFICIENMRGNYNESIRHLAGGSRLLLSALQDKPPSLPLPESNISLVSRSAKYRSDFCETDDIIFSFSRLGLDASPLVGENLVSQLALFGLPRSSDLPESSDTLVPFPSTTSALEELNWIEIAFDALYECSYSDMYREQSPGELESDQLELPCAFGFTADNKRIYHIIRQRFDRWSARIALSLNNPLHKSASQEDQIEWRYLQLYQFTWLSIFKEQDGWFSNPENQVEPQDLLSIVEETECLLQASPPTPHILFSFEGITLSSLVYAGLSTNCPDLLRRIVDILRRSNRREGLLDSNELAEVFEALLETSEARDQSLLSISEGFPILKVITSLNLSDISSTNSIVQLANRFVKEETIGSPSQIPAAEPLLGQREPILQCSG